jgi:hypothetical protein
MQLALLPLLLATSPADALAVLAVAEPPGPDAALVELTHQLRAACRARAAGVLDAPELRARLRGPTSDRTLAELERAYAGAMASYQAGDYGSTLRALRAILDDLEALPESPAAHAQWLRANLRLAHAELTVGRAERYRELLELVAATDPRHRPDPDQFSPTFRRDLEAARARVARRPLRALAISATGEAAVTVFLDGRAVGTAPVALQLPPGRHRVGGAAGALRVPSVQVDLRGDERRVVLDLALADALRPDAGPGLAAAAPARAAALAGAAGWLGVERVLAVSVGADGGAPVLVGTLHDASRGAIRREGRVRMAGGAVPAEHVAALAAFLLTGQPSPAVVDTTPGAPLAGAEGTAGAAASSASTSAASLAAPPLRPAPVAATSEALRALAQPPTATVTAPATGSRPGWMRPATYASAALAVGLGGLALQQALAASGSYGDARDLVLPDGAVSDSTRYRDLMSAGDSARRNAWIAAGGAVAFAAAAGVLGYLSFTDAGAPAVRF